MEQNNRSSLSTELIDLIKSYYSLMKDIVSLAGVEAKLTGKIIVRMIILSFIARLFLVTSWMLMNIMSVVYLMSFGYSLISALFLMMLINFVGFIVVFCWLRKDKKRLFFPVTCDQLRFTNGTNEEQKNERIRMETTTT